MYQKRIQKMIKPIINLILYILITYLCITFVQQHHSKQQLQNIINTSFSYTSIIINIIEKFYVLVNYFVTYINIYKKKFNNQPCFSKLIL